MEEAKILHLWRLVPIVSVKCPAFRRGGSAGRAVSGGVTMTYGGDSNAGPITAYKTLGLGRFEGGRAARGFGSRRGSEAQRFGPRGTARASGRYLPMRETELCKLCPGHDTSLLLHILICERVY